jgi:hypothetical protein
MAANYLVFCKATCSYVSWFSRLNVSWLLAIRAVWIEIGIDRGVGVNSDRRMLSSANGAVLDLQSLVMFVRLPSMLPILQLLRGCLAASRVRSKVDIISSSTH